MENVLSSWILQGGAFGLLALVIYWLTAKHIPSLQKTHLDALTMTNRTHKETMENLTDAFKEEQAETRAEMVKVWEQLRDNTNTMWQCAHFGKVIDDGSGKTTRSASGA